MPTRERLTHHHEGEDTHIWPWLAPVTFVLARTFGRRHYKDVAPVWQR